MTAEEYFGDWIKVIDKSELFKALRTLEKINPDIICPNIKLIFKAFRICPFDKCKVIMLGQDPYPQPGIATGILFGNSLSTLEENISPSLRVIKEAAIDYTIPHNTIEFDNSLESWAKQGILMINSALTCEVGKVGSHYSIWKGFVSKLLYNISSLNKGIVYVLFGNQAQSFSNNIIGSQSIISTYHPSYYARRGEKMSPLVFKQINIYLENMGLSKINFYKESDYGTC